MVRQSLTLAFAARSDVLEAVLDRVRDQGLGVGDKLPSIRELAEALGVKPGLVRDALLQAQTQGMMRILPRAGAFLQSFTPTTAADPLTTNLHSSLLDAPHNLFHLLDARRLLEIELAGRAAERRRLEDLLPVRRSLEAMIQLSEGDQRETYIDLDIRFHVAIAQLADNSVLVGMLRTLLSMLRPHLLAIPWSLARRRRTDASHAAIYAALVAGEADRARAVMSEHLSMAYDSLLRDLQETPPLSAGTAPRTEKKKLASN